MCVSSIDYYGKEVRQLDDDLARGAMVIALITFVMAVVLALVLNAKIDDSVEISTALACERVYNVVVCVEN